MHGVVPLRSIDLDWHSRQRLSGRGPHVETYFASPLTWPVDDEDELHRLVVLQLVVKRTGMCNASMARCKGEVRRGRHASHVRSAAGRVPALGDLDRRAHRHLDDAGRSGGRPRRRLRVEAEQLRPRCRHRALRRRPTAPLRAAGGARRDRHRRARQGVLRWCQHPDAVDLDTWPQGQLLQVHQRDAQLDRGCFGELRPGLPRRRERHRRRYRRPHRVLV